MCEKSVSIQSIFDLGSHPDDDIIVEASHEPVPMAPAMEICSANGCRFLRVRLEYDGPFVKLAELFRPELMFHPDGPGCANLVPGPALWVGKMENIIAPGDANVTVHISRPVAMQAMMFMAGPAEGLSEMIDVDPDTVAFRMRFIFRRDYPQKGEHCLAVIPRSSSGGLLEDCGPVSARCLRILQHQDPSKTVVVAFRIEPHVKEWATSVAPRMHGSFKSHGPRLGAIVEGAKRYAAAPSCADVLECDSNYVVVALRKCNRGGPLLPLARNSDDSIEWEPDNLTRPLPDYLRRLCSFLNTPDVEVYGTLDGWRLPPYQAAMTQRSWSRVQLLLEEPLKSMRTTYRRRLGGTTAPDLVAGVVPKLMELNSEAASAMQECMYKVPTSNTFIHFTNGVARIERSGSMSRFGDHGVS